jgi:hypothetical protein
VSIAKFAPYAVFCQFASIDHLDGQQAKESTIGRELSFWQLASTLACRQDELTNSPNRNKL